MISAGRSRNAGKRTLTTFNRKYKSSLNSPFETDFSRSRLDVAMIRVSTLTSSFEPMRVTFFSWIARSNFACRSGCISDTSSSNIVPPLASSNLPIRLALAPVNAPFSWPNNSDSRRFSGIAAQLTAINGPSLRFDLRWMKLDMTSLPVPLSPVIKTVASEGAIFSASCMTLFMAGSLAIIVFVS